jgi:hypothetical protein
MLAGCGDTPSSTTAGPTESSSTSVGAGSSTPATNAVTSTDAPAGADHPAVPEVGAGCSGHLANAQTFVVKDSVSGVNLQCTSIGKGGYQWRPVAFHRPVTKLLTFGPSMTLMGLSANDVEFPSSWTGLPENSDAQCIEEQRPVASPGQLGPSIAQAGGTGQPLLFEFVPNLYDVKLSGNCLWLKVDS